MGQLRRVLVIDDDVDYLISMRMQLRGVYGVLTASSIAEGLKLLAEHDVDLVLMDVDLHGEDGLQGIRRIHAVHPSVGVAMQSGIRDVRTVVEAIRMGAVDYLTKPFTTDDLTTVMEKAIAARRVQERCEALLHSQGQSNGGRFEIIHRSARMQKLMQEAEQTRNCRANVLIVGETGTGKELFARHLHELGGAGKRPFIAVNCAAIPEHLLESELFGHESGAFTGANRRRIGKFELADGGDIFLDEISTMKLDLQVKLLRVLQEREFCRLGSNQPIHADFRVLSACNQSLDSLVESGSFRADLYHRLMVIQFALPPLRERLEDIPLLVEHFLKRYAMGGSEKRMTESAMVRLMEYAWPGNVRELANVVQSLVVLTPEPEIDASAFPPWALNGYQLAPETAAPQNALPIKPGIVQEDGSLMELKQYVQQAERRYLQEALDAFNGDKSKAARGMGIGRTTLYMKLRELGML